MGWENLGTALGELRSDVARSRRRTSGMTRNPHTHTGVRSAGFESDITGRVLAGWDTSSQTIDYYLYAELRKLRARSRAMARKNPYGKRFVTILKSNVVGPNGVTVQAQSVRFNSKTGTTELDTPANDAIEAAFRDWGRSENCDYTGKHSWCQLQNLAIQTAGVDGAFLFEKIKGPGAGKYGFQLRFIDPELLDIELNKTAANGNEIRLGIEYDQRGRRVRYHFHKRNRVMDFGGGYTTGERYSIDAGQIIHGFIPEYADQSHGIPWMHAGLERSKHLEKFDEAALVKSRAGASTMAVIYGDHATPYTGDEEGDGAYAGDTLDHYEPGVIKDIGNRQIMQLDPDYPHEMYAAFVKATVRSLASAWGISYPTLSSDLEGVNYSSIRAGVLEDREIFTALQNWFIETLVSEVYREFIKGALLKGAIKIGTTPLRKPVDEYFPARFQGRRWAWVDPQKDSTANQMAIDNVTKSRSQIIRDAGHDPESVFREIQAERELMAQYGIQPTQTKMPAEPAGGEQDE